MSTNESTSAERMGCSRCQKCIPDDVAICLWDGRYYCQECVDGCCPGMYSRAVTERALQIPLDSCSVLRGCWSLLIFYCGIVFTFVMPWVVVAALNGEEINAVSAIAAFFDGRDAALHHGCCFHLFPRAW